MCVLAVSISTHSVALIYLIFCPIVILCGAFHTMESREFLNMIYDTDLQISPGEFTPTQLKYERVIVKVFEHYDIPLSISEKY